MRVWIGCLASYNNGRLHGEWFDVSTDPDVNEANFAKVLRSSPYPNVTRTDDATGETYATAEEAFCADYEAPRPIVHLLGEYPGAEALADAARILEELDGVAGDRDLAEAALSEMLDGLQLADLADLDAADWFRDHYAGSGDTLRDWCEDHLAETGFFEGINLDDGSDRAATICRYFDFEAYARDLVNGGEIHTERSGDKVHVFWSR